MSSNQSSSNVGLNIDKLLFPELLTREELFQALRRLQVRLPDDLSTFEVIEIYKKIALPLPQRKNKICDTTLTVDSLNINNLTINSDNTPRSRSNTVVSCLKNGASGIGNAGPCKRIKLNRNFEQPHSLDSLKSKLNGFHISNGTGSRTKNDNYEQFQDIRLFKYNSNEMNKPEIKNIEKRLQNDIISNQGLTNNREKCKESGGKMLNGSSSNCSRKSINDNRDKSSHISELPTLNRQKINNCSSNKRKCVLNQSTVDDDIIIVCSDVEDIICISDDDTSTSVESKVSNPKRVILKRPHLLKTGDYKKVKLS